MNRSDLASGLPAHGRFRVACAHFKGALSAYWRELDALEMSEAQSRAKASTQARWRQSAPADAGFVPRVPVEVAALGFQGPVAEAWFERAIAVAGRLGADTMLVQTAADFRPTTANRRALIDFFGPRRRPGLRVAWRAEGLWDGQPEDRAEVCEAAGLVPVVDPMGIDDDDLEGALPGGEFVYWRLLGRVGGSMRFSEADLERLIALLDDRTGGYIVFGAGWMTGDARRLRALLTLAEGADAPGGLDLPPP